MQRSCRRARPSGWWTSARRTGRRWTGGASSACGSTTARASRSARRRSPSLPSGNRSTVSMVASTGVAEVLLVLKIAFLVLLYLFVVRVIRSAGGQRQGAGPGRQILPPPGSPPGRLPLRVAHAQRGTRVLL